MNKPIINGIDVSECNIRFNHFEKSICELGNRKLGELHYLCSENPNCFFKQFKRVQGENEKIKKQYNCYACGSCNGTEDYINLEKHHKGLRKQFDELAKRNNALSLRIEELEKENEKLKVRFNELYNNAEQLVNKYNKYDGNKENELIEIINKTTDERNKYKQALEEIREMLKKSMSLKSNAYNHFINVEKAIDKINEALNEQK